MREEVETGGLLVCPVCKGILQGEGDGFRCRRCPARYPSADGVWDLRSPRSKEATGGRWDPREFESAYEALGDYDTGAQRAERSGVPGFVEEYRYARIKGRLLEWIAAAREARALLDVGCGVGYFLREVEERLGPGPRIVAGIDVVPVRVRSAHRKFEGREGFIAAVASAEEIPFADGQFDVVICTEVMEHVESPEAAFREIARVLRPGGLLCFSSPNRIATDLWEGIFGLPRLLRRIVRRTIFEAAGGPYDVPIGPRRLLGLFRRSGLRIEEFRRVVFLPHESYFRFLPAWLNRSIVAVGGCLEARAPALARWLGLHYVVRARRLPASAGE